MGMRYIGRKLMRVNKRLLNVSYEISDLAFRYFVYEKELAMESPSILADIVIPQILETGDENLSIKVERLQSCHNISIHYIPRDTRLDGYRASMLDN